MQHYKLKNYARQAGMTLIELSVVLLILVGLAGLLIPYVSGFNQKTHDSANVDNLASLNNNLARYATEKNKNPKNLESLINGTAVGTPSGVCAVANGGDPAISKVYCGMLDVGVLNATTVTVPNAISLMMAGITTVLDNNGGTDNKTFKSTLPTPRTLITFPAGVPTPEATVGKLATIGCARKADGTVDTAVGCEATHLATIFGGQASLYDTACYDYVALGIGDGNDLIGTTMSSAPVHFATNGDQGPIQNFNHYIAVYKADKSNTAPCSTGTDVAKLVGAAMVVPSYPNSHIFGLQGGLAYGYDNQAGTNNP